MAKFKLEKMTRVENRAWFLSADGRAPLYFHVLYDDKKNRIHFLNFTKGKYISLKDKECVYFYVEHEGKYADKHRKYANRDYVMKWDFLPQSVAPIANKKALQLLEKEAPGEFQAIPVKILLPDGSYIKDYTLINPLNKIQAINSAGLNFPIPAASSEVLRKISLRTALLLEVLSKQASRN